MSEQTATEILKAAAKMYAALVKPANTYEKNPSEIFDRCVEAVHQSYLKLTANDQRSAP